jgi:hypothetical protein
MSSILRWSTVSWRHEESPPLFIDLLVSTTLLSNPISMESAVWGMEVKCYSKEHISFLLLRVMWPQTKSNVELEGVRHCQPWEKVREARRRTYKRPLQWDPRGSLLTRVNWTCMLTEIKSWTESWCFIWEANTTSMFSVKSTVPLALSDLSFFNILAHLLCSLQQENCWKILPVCNER